VEEAKEERIENALEEHDVPNVIEPWAHATEKKRKKMVEVLETIQKNSIRKYSQIDHYCGVSGARSEITPPRTRNSARVW